MTVGVRQAGSPCLARLLACVALGLGGCAAPASQQAMIVQPPVAAAARQHPRSVGVTVIGGRETGVLDSSNIANADLETAIEASIRASGLFREVVQGPDGDHVLAVSIIQLSKPIFGLTFDVDLEAGWSLTRVGDARVMLRKSIRSTGQASMGDAFSGVTRLSLAVEAAARSNIEQGLAEIARLDL